MNTGKRFYTVAVLVLLMIAAVFAFSTGRAPLKARLLRYDLSDREQPAAIVNIANRTSHYFVLRPHTKRGDLFCIYDQENTFGKTQWIGSATLATNLASWPRPIHPGESITFRVPVPTSGTPVQISFEGWQEKTRFDEDSYVWKLRYYAMRSGLYNRAFTLRVHEPLAVNIPEE